MEDKKECIDCWYFDTGLCQWEGFPEQCGSFLSRKDGGDDAERTE